MTQPQQVQMHSSSAEETLALGRSLASVLQPGDVISLSGDLGAGKTRLVQGVAEGLGVRDRVTSPTFGLMAEHEGRVRLIHFDLYRLEDAEQLEDVDFWGQLESGGASFVEWGDRFPQALPDDYLGVELHVTGLTERVLRVSASGPRAEELLRGWAKAAVRGVGPAAEESS